MPDLNIRINTEATGDGAARTRRDLDATTAAVKKLTEETGKSAVASAQFFADQQRAAEQAATRARVLANIKATRAGSDSSGFGDNSGAAEARIQRRLQLQREELGLTTQSIPITDQATLATDKFGLSHRQAAAALKQLGHEIPGLHLAAAGLKNPYLAAAVALAALVFASRKAKDEQLAIANEQQARLSNSVDLQILKLEALATAHAKTATAARDHATALEELERQASGIDAKLGEMDEAAQRKLREDNAGAEAAKAKELLGIAGLPDDERAARTREITARYDRERRGREQQALVGQAARLADADRQAQAQAADARRAIPGAAAGVEAATGDAARNEGLRKKASETLENLKAELARAKGTPPNNAWATRLHSATWGLLGRPWSFNRPVAEIEADIKRFSDAEAGFGAGREEDAAEVRARQNELGRLQGVERGGSRFRPRVRSAMGDVGTGKVVTGYQDEEDRLTAANAALRAVIEKEIRQKEEELALRKESNRRQEQVNSELRAQMNSNSYKSE